jgi:hypothetical protein
MNHLMYSGCSGYPINWEIFPEKINPNSVNKVDVNISDSTDVPNTFLCSLSCVKNLKNAVSIPKERIT